MLRHIVKHFRNWKMGRNSLQRAQTEIDVSKGMSGTGGKSHHERAEIVREWAKSDSPKIARLGVMNARQFKVATLKKQRQKTQEEKKK